MEATDSEKILQLSVFVEDLDPKEDKIISPRAEVRKGPADWHAIIGDEIAGKYIKRVQQETFAPESIIATGKGSLGEHISNVVDMFSVGISRNTPQVAYNRSDARTREHRTDRT